MDIQHFSLIKKLQKIDQYSNLTAPFIQLDARLRTIIVERDNKFIVIQNYQLIHPTNSLRIWRITIFGERIDALGGVVSARSTFVDP